jgi:hypothetical protein
MDLKNYFKQIREIERSLTGPSVVVVSEETDDGGKAGIRTAASPYLAAKAIVERRARLATPEEAQAFYDEHEQAKKAAEELAAASRVQFTVVPARSEKQ